MELKKYLLAGGIASVLVLGACGNTEDTTTEDAADDAATETEETVDDAATETEETVDDAATEVEDSTTEDTDEDTE